MFSFFTIQIYEHYFNLQTFKAFIFKKIRLFLYVVEHVLSVRIIVCLRMGERMKEQGYIYLMVYICRASCWLLCSVVCWWWWWVILGGCCRVFMECYLVGYCGVLFDSYL